MNGLTFCITQHWVTGKLTPSQKALFISSALIVYAFDHIGTVRHGLRNLYDIDSDWDIFSCGGGVGGVIKPRIWTSVITCNLDIAGTLYSNKEWVVRASSSSAEKGHWICCKPAWGLQMAPNGSMCHTTTIMWLIHRLQEIGTTWNHQRSALPPGTTPSKDFHIRLKHLWGQWRPSTRTVVETPRRHNARISTQTMRYYLDLYCVPDDRIEAPSWIGSGVLQGPTWLRYTAFPFSICLTQDFPRSNAMNALPWPANSPSDTSSSIGEGPHWLPDKVTWPTCKNHGAVLPGNGMTSHRQ